MFCNSCGSELKSGAKFCDICGSQIIIGQDEIIDFGGAVMHSLFSKI
ncbi:MAG: zinc-ribbon domain-containing protein [Coriobacteriales bacterium]|jgi:rRNA maturation endonuclease Nob1|nr:zinc-ribbon domain-containing protein [Coriobacteriales bacterium]